MTANDTNAVAKMHFRYQLEDAISSLLIRHELGLHSCEKLYIVFGSEMRLPQGTGVGGMTAPLMSSALRQEIGRRWIGNGPCILICDQEYATHFDNVVANLFTSIAIHELAHAVDRNTFCGDVTHDWQRAGGQKSQLFHHPWSWLRTMIHLSERAIAKGILQSPICMHTWGLYSAEQSYHQCLSVLRDEIRSLSRDHISVLKTVFPPHEFIAMCAGKKL